MSNFEGVRNIVYLLFQINVLNYFRFKFRQNWVGSQKFLVWREKGKKLKERKRKIKVLVCYQKFKKINKSVNCLYLDNPHSRKLRIHLTFPANSLIPCKIQHKIEIVRFIALEEQCYLNDFFTITLPQEHELVEHLQALVGVSFGRADCWRQHNCQLSDVLMVCNVLVVVLRFWNERFCAEIDNIIWICCCVQKQKKFIRQKTIIIFNFYWGQCISAIKLLSISF